MIQAVLFQLNVATLTTFCKKFVPVADFFFFFFFFFFFLHSSPCAPVGIVCPFDVVQGRRPFVVRARGYSGTFRGPCHTPRTHVCSQTTLMSAVSLLPPLYTSSRHPRHIPKCSYTLSLLIPSILLTAHTPQITHFHCLHSRSLTFITGPCFASICEGWYYYCISQIPLYLHAHASTIHDTPQGPHHLSSLHPFLLSLLLYHHAYP